MDCHCGGRGDMLQHVGSPMGLLRSIFISAGLNWLKIVQVGRWHPHTVLLFGLQETHSWKQMASYGCEKNSLVLPSVYHFEALSTLLCEKWHDFGNGWGRVEQGNGERDLSVGDIWQESAASRVHAWGLERGELRSSTVSVHSTLQCGPIWKDVYTGLLDWSNFSCFLHIVIPYCMDGLKFSMWINMYLAHNPKVIPFSRSIWWRPFILFQLS